MSRRKKPARRGQTPTKSSGSGGAGIVSALMGHATGGLAVGPAAGSRSDPRSGLQADPAKIAERYHRIGRFDEAERLYKDILKRAPNHPRVNALMGMLQNRKERHDEAVRSFKKSLKQADTQAEAWNGLGTAYRSQGRFDDAVKAYTEALKHDPDFAGAYSNMGIAHREAGDFTRAIESYEMALSLDPNLPEAWNGLARSRRFDVPPRNLEKLQKIANSPKISNMACKHANFALGKIHDDLGRYDEAFGYFVRANDLRTAPANASKDCALMERVAAAYSDTSGPLSQTASGVGPRPVFVLGMPRSGTTLIEQILASHPAVVGGGELNFFTEQALRLGLDREKRSTPADLQDKIVAETNRMRRDFFNRFPKKAEKSGVTPAVVVDKTPFNFLYLGMIRQVLPEARIVHCIREPLDTGLSIFFTDFAVNQPFTTDLACIGVYIRCYEELMQHWRKIQILPIYDLKYEDLVADQERLTRELIDFCGLEWNDMCLNYHKTQRYISTPSDWQVRQPIYKGSMSRWRHYEKHLQPLMRALEATDKI